METCYPLIVFALLLTNAGRAQSQNALDFDGVNDKVTVPAAAALITGGTGISLTCWAYPRNAAPAYPDFDGFAGLRNDADADFYLLQVSPSNTVEARFRNSAGEDFTLEYSGLVLNTWQFLVLNYDGNELTLYADGINVATAPANGSITNATGDLLIGDLIYQDNDFSLNGKVDEVSLWNRALTQTEIDCIHTSGINLSSSGLQLYYKMDQGTAGGNNAGINTLIDSKGNINGGLSGFALNGATSNFVAGPAVGNSIGATICQGDSYLFDGQLLTAAGVYSAAYDIGELCDSLVTLTLGFTTVDTTVVQVGATLTSTAPFGPWQWLDCGNGYAPIPGATAQSFTASTSGSYALRKTQSGCSDTSACHEVIISGIADSAPLETARLFPDPAIDHIGIDLGQMLPQISVTVFDAEGRVRITKEFSNVRAAALQVGDLATGIYLVELRSGRGIAVHRLVKQ